VVLLIVVAIAVLALAWVLKPELVLMLLHAWQPKLF
jgi:hypothetical protein